MTHAQLSSYMYIKVLKIKVAEFLICLIRKLLKIEVVER